MTDPATRAACTIVSPNYLPYARTLAHSFLEHHPGHRFFVLLVADFDPALASRFAGEPYIPVFLSNIGISNLHREAMKYDILELNTNVKPTFLKHLLLTHALTHLIYLDPDILCYAPLTPVFDALTTHDAVLTPHITSPIQDDRSPSEQDLLVNGTYNLGFFAVRNTSASFAILSWWECRCLELGFSEGRTGLFVDQKWMNLLPGLFDRIRILRHPGCNMAYWNLHERSLTQYSGRTIVQGPPVQGLPTQVPLCFFHFSGLDPSDPTSLSRNTDRFTLAQRPDLARLFADYKTRVLANANPALDSLAYGFATFSDGTIITRLSRRLYAQLEESFPDQDPFDSGSHWARYAKSHRLVAGAVPPPKSGWSQFDAQDSRVRWVHRLLRFALRLLGPHRYELLMRYLGHISVLRHQSVFLNRDIKPPLP